MREVAVSMGLLSSLRGLIFVMRRDLRVARHGVWLGWYTLTHYRGRLQARREQPNRAGSTAVRVHGSRLRVFLTPPHIGAFFGIFIEEEYNLDAASLGFTPQTILDLGANVGMASAYMSVLFPSAQFLCVEPDPRNIPLLEKTIAANSIKARVAPVAISAEAGTLRLRMGRDPTCSALESSPMHELADSVEVEVKTIPQLLTEFDWDGIDLLKIDIEGTERELLGRNNAWLDKVKAMILEIHPNTSPQEIGRFLAPFGFHLSRFGHGSEPVYLAKRN